MYGIRLTPHAMNMMETNMHIKDNLDYYKEGFRDGEKFVLDVIKQTTKQEFKELTELIIWIREHQGVQNETK